MLVAAQPLHSYSYGIPYFCLILLAILWDRKKQISVKLNRNEFFFTVVLILFFGLRGFVQTDCLNYVYIYDQIPTIGSIKSIYNGIEGIEQGFYLYTSLVKTVYDNFHFWVFVNSIIDILIFTWFFKRYSTSVFLSWVVFFIFSGLVIEFNLYRNVKAICLFLISIPYLEQRKFLRFFALWIVSLSFHTSALLYLPAYFILKRNAGRLLPLIVLIVVNIIFFLNLFPTSFIVGHIVNTDNALVSKAIYYLSVGKEQGITLGYIERLMVYILCMTLGNKLVAKSSTNRIFINSFYIYYILWYIFSDVSVFVERFPVLFAYSYWILIPGFISICNLKYRKLIYYIVILFLSLKVFILTDHILYKYDNIIWGIENVDTRSFNKDRYMLNR